MPWVLTNEDGSSERAAANPQDPAGTLPPMFSEGTITFLMFCRSSAPLTAQQGFCKDKGQI